MLGRDPGFDRERGAGPPEAGAGQRRRHGVEPFLLGRRPREPVYPIQQYPVRDRAAFVALGQHYDALISAGLGLVNTAISTFQETRVKRQLDRLSLISSPRVTVVREGRERDIVPAELVTGDACGSAPGTRSSWTG